MKRHKQTENRVAIITGAGSGLGGGTPHSRRPQIYYRGVKVTFWQSRAMSRALLTAPEWSRNVRGPLDESISW